MALFAVTIFIGSFLLFQVELIIARIVLPWFGGAAAVWTTCLLFFQIMLLLGYLYAHGLVRYFRPKTQFLIHLVLLVTAAFLLPILPDASWKPAGTEAPLLRILTLLTAVVGLSFFLLSSTSPLLSYWFARAFPGSSPYRLYALSNLGSMLGLLSYPTLIEPNLTIRAQAYGWSGAFLAFSAMCALASGKGTFKLQRTSATPPDTTVEEDPPPPLPSAEQWFFWIALPASGSVLLLGVTNHLTQNVAAIPFLWVLPLSLYLLSFTLAFWGPALYPRAFYVPLLALSILGMEILFFGPFTVVPLKILLPIFCIGMFAGCMVCHGELALMAPDPRYLTRYYLAIATGGALGGLFVGVAAPLFFRMTYELPLGIAACAILALTSSILNPGGSNWEQRWHRALLILASSISIVVAGLWFYYMSFQPPKGLLLLDRNFFGVLKVADTGTPGDRNSQRTLIHGSINHGAQFLQPERRREPITYYHPNSGVGLAIFSRGSSYLLRVGIIGLGAGIIAAHGRTGDVYRFYEINPLVVKIAGTNFTYLRDSRAKVEVILGDARLSLEREPQQNYDVLIVDAFSGDAIPIHLLTREAFQQYLRHIKKDGILALHITNRYIDLKPVTQRLAEKVGMETIAVNTAGNPVTGAAAAEWVLLSADKDILEKPPLRGAGKALPMTPNVRMWTDDYSSLFHLLK